MCKAGCHQGLIIADSGVGKTQACEEFCRRDFDAVLVNCDITMRSVGSLLQKIYRLVGSNFYGSNSDLLDSIIRRLRELPRFLLFDEAHFLRWEQFELLRKIHDSAKVGIVFLGQGRLYDEMRSVKSRYLYDQISSRLVIKRYIGANISREDAELIANSIYSGLDKKCIGYLHERALGDGKFRSMVNLLRVAARVSQKEGERINLDFLREISGQIDG